MYYAQMTSPVGTLIFAGADKVCVEAISFANGRDATEIPEDASFDEENFVEARRQISEYFEGARKAFDFPMRLISKGFRKQILENLHRLPFGETISYKELGASIGNPNAARAVGGAVGSNPLPIVIPCHRVLASDGGIGGFGGGLDAKRTLLRLEGVEVD